MLLWTPDDNATAESAGESLVASGGFIFVRMAIATQIISLRHRIVPYNILVVQFGGIVVISIEGEEVELNGTTYTRWC
jgi:hypothetical protein